VSMQRKFLPGPRGPLLLPSKSPRVSLAFSQFPAREPAPWPPGKASPVIARFGPFEVNFDRRELRRHGMKIRLEDKPFEILEALLREPGRMVTREELRARLWPDTFVSYEHCLNTAVNKLRSAVGDSSRYFRFIETVRRRGYRFIGALEPTDLSDPRQSRAVLLVLPFRVQSPNRAAEFFADGLTEEISAQLGRLDPQRLALISVATAMLCKRSECSTKEIGQKVRADIILEGSVRHAAGRVRVGAQLVQSSDQLCVWSEIYECPAAAPLACQAQIAQQVAASLAAHLGLSNHRAFSPSSAAPLSMPSQRIRKISS
jgi:TolB-like protein